MEATVSDLLLLQKYMNSKQDSEIKDYTLRLYNISRGFFIINNLKKAGLKGTVKIFLSIIMLLLLIIF